MTTINGIDHHGSTKPYPGKEDDLQIMCANYLTMHKRKPLFFHVPNGGKRNMTTVANKHGISKDVPLEAQRLKAMGTKAGVSDLVILERSVTNPHQMEFTVCHALFIELKAKGGTLQDTQAAFLLAAKERGYKVAVVWNFDSFKEIIDSYLK